MTQNSPCSESDPDCEIRPGEDIMDYLERHSKYMDERSEKFMTEFKALCQATNEKFNEVVFYCNLASKAWDETTARIQAIRAQDDRH